MHRVPPRLPGLDYVGFLRYFLTICCAHRQPVLKDSTVAEDVIAKFLQLAVSHQFAVIAYCAMPDHVHALVEGRSPESSLCEYVRCAKQITGYEFKQRVRSPLWQRGYFDRVLRREEDSREIARYIVENPVRAGLVAHCRDYPFVGSGMCTRQELLEWIYG